MSEITKPIALDESLHTTEQTPRNLADVLSDELQNLATAISGGSDKVPKTDIATVEPTNIASRAYSVGELVYVNGTLYEVKTAIAIGATFTVGTNIQSTNVSGTVKDALDELQDDIIFANDTTKYNLPAVGASIDVTKTVTPPTGYSLVGIINTSSGTSSTACMPLIVKSNAYITVLNVSNSSQVGTERTMTWTNIFKKL